LVAVISLGAFALDLFRLCFDLFLGFLPILYGVSVFVAVLFVKLIRPRGNLLGYICRLIALGY
jgi:hypothetical protein